MDLTSSALRSRRPQVAPQPPRARWIAFGSFAVLVLMGLALRLLRDTSAGSSQRDLVAIAAAVVAIGGGAALLVPSANLVLASAIVATGGVAVLGNRASNNICWFGLCVLSVWCVLAGSRGAGPIYCIGTLPLLGAEWIWGAREPGWGAWAVGVAFSVIGATVVRREQDLVAQLRTAQAGLAERATVEERNRIARELHDVIAHSLTVSLLHVSSARLAIQHDPADAIRALTEAERFGRESLAEVRSVVGLLREDDQESDIAAAPLPELSGLPALIEQYRSAGAGVMVNIAGDLCGLPATVGLAGYRIVQEALTNAVKHAPGAAITIDIEVNQRAVGLTVDSDGQPGHGSGLGVLSMRERAHSLGGTCEAGPGGTGWLVRATLPLPAGPFHQDAT